MSAPLFFSHPSSLEHDTGSHPEAIARIAAVLAELEERGWLGYERVESPAVARDVLELVHPPRYIESIERFGREGGGHLDADTVVSSGSLRAALHACGGAVEMVSRLLDGGAAVAFSAHRPPGHHALPERAMGFCLFNSVAVAAAFAVRALGLQRVLILDWDVHHGNGTAEIFRSRPDVLVANIHQQGLYPGTGGIVDAGSGAGRGYTINVPVPPGSGEEVWLSVLEHLILPAGLEFEPDLILISAGFDGHRADPLADCRLESSSYEQLACHVRDFAERCGAPVGAVLEGGYDTEALTESVLATIQALAGGCEPESIAPDPLVTSRAAAHIGHYWTL